MRTRRNRFVRATVWLLAIAAVICVAGPYVAGWVIADRLQEMVRRQINGRLVLSRVAYIPPYTVYVGQAELMVEEGDVSPQSVLSVDSLTLKLAESPFGKSGPLVIERLEIHQPSVRLIQTGHGLLGAKLLTISDEGKSRQKLSEIFRLRHLGIRQGLVEYQDRTSPGSQPMVWRGINADIQTEQQSASAYHYTFTAHNDPVARVQSEGTFDLDDLVLQARSLGLRVRVGSGEDSGGRESVLPPSLQAILARYQVHGGLEIDAAGVLPLREPRKAMYEATVRLNNGSAYMPEADATLDLLAVKGTVRNEPASDASSHKIRVTLESVEAASGDATLKISNATAEVIPGVGWLVPDSLGELDLGGAREARASRDGLGRRSRKILREFDLSGKVMFGFLGSGAFGESAAPTRWSVSLIPQGVSARPPGFPNSLSEIRGGMVTATESAIVLKNLTARYGRDMIALETATIPLTNIERRTQVNDIAMTIAFAPATTAYPATIERVISLLHPDGNVKITGDFSAVRRGHDDYNLLIESIRCGLAATGKRIPITDVQFAVAATPQRVEVRDFSGSTLGGRVSARGIIQTPRGQPARYEGEIAATDLDVRDLAAKYLAADTAGKLIGRGYLSAHLAGTAGPGVSDPLATLAARGQAEILHGEFWSAPVLEGIRGQTKIAAELLTGSQAAARFSIADRTVTLRRVAVSSPALGLQGNGTVDFDGNVRMQLVAAPLADWKEGMRRTGIPIVSEVAGEIVGGIQKLLNTATRNLLYQFRVEGTILKPDIRTVPAPVLTDGAAALFGRMLGSDKDHHLIESLGEGNGDKP